MKKPKAWLKRLDVDGVHLVGDPANQRPFAIVKSLLGKKTPRADPTKQGVSTVKTSALLKALGLVAATANLPDGIEDKEISVGDLLKGIDKDDIVKALDLKLAEPDPKQKPPNLEGLDPEVRKYIDGIKAEASQAKTAVDEIIKAREETETAEIETLRVQLQKRTGAEIPEAATRGTLEAIKLVADTFDDRLRKMGVFELKGSAEEADGTAIALVKAEVRKRLGREPATLGEEMSTRREIYRDNPGLLNAVTKEERASRLAIA